MCCIGFVTMTFTCNGAWVAYKFLYSKHICPIWAIASVLNVCVSHNVTMSWQPVKWPQGEENGQNGKWNEQ